MAKTKPNAGTGRLLLSDVCRALDKLAPPRLAQEWDNVGLLAGDRTAAVRRALLCIDLMPDVVAEAVRRRVQVVVAYHPPIFRPISSVTMPGHDTCEAVYRCIAAGVGIYSTHTALDAAEGGTNDVIAGFCGLTDTEPLEHVGDIDEGECKLVAFVPPADLAAVTQAMFTAGAGRIGDYEECSFRIPGTGTFRGTESTSPVIGRAGRHETVHEIRLEVITPRGVLPDVVQALTRAHPYEEPAFDIYPLHAAPQRGIGRHGKLPKPVRLSALARRLKKLTGAAGVQLVGRPDQTVGRVVVCVGAAGSLPFKRSLGDGDVIVTGEIRHHDALTTLRHGCCAIALGHWASERPVLGPFREALVNLIPKLDVLISEADRDPFASV